MESISMTTAYDDSVLIAQTTHVFLVCGGNVPEDVFGTHEGAVNFIADRVKMSGLPPTYFRVYKFEVK